MPEWLRNWAQRYKLFPVYVTALIRFWQNFLWGESVIAAGMIVYMAFFHPPAWAVATYFLFVMLVAGYLVWRTDHMRLMPKLEIDRHPIIQMSPNADKTKSAWIQLVVKSLTDVSVENCQGHLIRVMSKPEGSTIWQRTEINETLPLGWSLASYSPITIHPGVPKRLNVFYLHSEQQRVLYPAIDPIPLRAWDVLTRQEPFRFEIRITANDCKPLDCALECERGNEWDKPKVKLVFEEKKELSA